MGWKEFANALDAYTGDGLGIGTLYSSVGLKTCHCALGAAFVTAAPEAVSAHTGTDDVAAEFGLDIEEAAEVGYVNDAFCDGDVSLFARAERLAFMRTYARARADGSDHAAALALASSTVRPIGAQKAERA